MSNKSNKLQSLWHIGAMAIVGGLLTWFFLYIDRKGAFDENYALGYIPDRDGQPEMLWRLTEDIANSEDGNWLEGHHLILTDPLTGETLQDVYLEAPEEENELPSNMKVVFNGERFYIVHPPEFVQGKIGFAHVVDLKQGPILEVVPESGKPWHTLKGPVYIDRNFRGDTVLLLTDKLNETHCLNLNTGKLKDGACDVYWGAKKWTDFAWEEIAVTSSSIRSRLWYWGQDSAYRTPEGEVKQYEEITITINDGMQEIIQEIDPSGKMHTDTTMQVRKYNPYAGYTIGSYLNQDFGGVRDTSILSILKQCLTGNDTLLQVGDQDWINASIIWCDRTAAIVLHEDLEAVDKLRISCVDASGLVRWIITPEALPLLRKFGSSGEDKLSPSSIDWTVICQDSTYILLIGPMAALRLDALSGKVLWSVVF